MNNKTLFIAAAACFAIAFVGGVAVYKNQQTPSLNQEAKTALTREGAPVKGSKDAKVTIVEFFDPACGTCRQFYPLVNNIVQKYRGKVKLVKRYAPLHQGSPEVVKMIEAAHLQGKFWPVVERLYSNQHRWVEHHVANPQQAMLGIKPLLVDQEKFMRDWQSSEVAQIIAQDIHDGKILKVRATPQFFVNGKPLTEFGHQQLLDLVDEAIAKAYAPKS